MKYLLSLLLITLTMTTMVPHVGPVQTHIPKVYEINLEDSPEVRWAPLIKDYKDPLDRFS